MKCTVIDYATTKTDINEIVKSYTNSAIDYDLRESVSKVNTYDKNSFDSLQSLEGFYSSEARLLDELVAIRFGGLSVIKRRKKGNLVDQFWEIYSGESEENTTQYEYKPNPLVAFLYPNLKKCVFKHTPIKGLGIKEVKRYSENLLKACGIPADFSTFHIKRFNSTNIEQFRETVCSTKIANTSKIQAKTRDCLITIDTEEKDSSGQTILIKDVSETDQYCLSEDIKDDPDNRRGVSLIVTISNKDNQDNENYYMIFPNLTSYSKKRNSGNYWFYILPTKKEKYNQQLYYLQDALSLFNKHSLACGTLHVPYTLDDFPSQ